MTETPSLPTGFINAEQADPAEQLNGPYFKHETECQTLFWPREEHTNMMGMVHGGVLMTFADFTLCSSATRGTDDTGCVTVNLNCNFTGNTSPGGWIEGSAEITRRTRNMVFVTGQLTSNDEVLLSFNGIGKRIRK